MELTFEKQDNFYVSEFQLTSDANLHIEKSTGKLQLFQRTIGAGDYAEVKDFDTSDYDSDKIIDIDLQSLVYPKWIKIKSAVKPLIATITTDGEVNEVVYQAKDIEITSNGTTKVTADTGYTALASVNVKVNVPSEGGGENSGSGSKWTGHADVEGLKAIGWTDEDIAYYQENGVNWNEEDDEYHKVSDDNKALYGVLTADNIQEYTDRIVYLPKIDTSGVTNMDNFFNSCYVLIAIPYIDTQQVQSMQNMFYDCSSLTCIPLLNTSKVTDMYYMFSYCISLRTIPQLDTSKVTDMTGIFFGAGIINIPKLNVSNVIDANYAFSETYITTLPDLDFESATSVDAMCGGCKNLQTISYLNIKNATKVNSLFRDCYNLKTVSNLNIDSAVSASDLFENCYNLTTIPNITIKNSQDVFRNCYSIINISRVVDCSGDDNFYNYCYNLKNIEIDIFTKQLTIKHSAFLSKQSLLYIIEHSNVTTASNGKIILHPYAYERLANDSDILTMLANRPNVSLAK